MLAPIIVPAQDAGEIYYVAVNGDDTNPGTYSQPWGTWQKGFESVRAGDTLFIRGGVYMNDLPVLIDPDHYRGPKGGIGTYDQPTVISGFPGEWPILDCSNHCANIPERPYGQRGYFVQGGGANMMVVTLLLPLIPQNGALDILILSGGKN